MTKNSFKIFSFIIFIISMVILTVISLPLIKAYGSPEEFKAFIDSLGVWGFFMMAFIQIFQIVVALIPGEVVETLAGIIYGPFGGLFFCMACVAIGQSIIFKAVRVLGKDFVEKAAGSKAMKKFKFLENEKQLKRVLFFLFFIPGTPKDLITYIVPITKISYKNFMIISLIARIPSILSSTYGGSALAEYQFLKAAIIYGAIALFFVIGMLIYKIWDKHHTK